MIKMYTLHTPDTANSNTLSCELKNYKYIVRYIYTNTVYFSSTNKPCPLNNFYTIWVIKLCRRTYLNIYSSKFSIIQNLKNLLVFYKLLFMQVLFGQLRRY